MDRHDEIKQIIERNGNMVYRLAYAQMKNSADTDDVYQEVFYRYIRNSPCLKMKSMKKHGSFALP